MTIPTVIIEFDGLPDFVISKEEYKSYGNFFKFCWANGFDPKEVRKVRRVLLSEDKYPSEAWQG